MMFQKRIIVPVLLAAFFAVGIGTPATSTVPAAPTNLTAASASSTSISLAWSDNSTDETGFIVQRSPNGSSKWTKVAQTVPDATSFVNTGLTTGKLYFYRVCAAINRSKSAYTNIASATPQGTTNQGPTANAGADRSTPTLAAVSFDGSASSDADGTITTYSWSFGDGASASGMSVTHSYATAGTYTATLTVTDNGGMTSSDSAIVTVTNRAPVANAGSDQSAAMGATVNFNGGGSSDADGSILSYSWSFGDGGTGTGAAPSHVYSTPGNYTVSLTVMDNNGASGSDTAIVSVGAAANLPPVANAGADQTALSLTTITFDGSGSSDPDGNISTYSWNFGDGSTATGMTAAHLFRAGTFTVTLTVTDNLGATASDTAIINATNRPPVANAGNDQTALSLTTLTFNGSGSTDPDGSLSSYSWNFGDGATATGMTASHAFAAPGTFTVTLTVTDNMGATVSDTAMVNATNRAPVANAGADQTALSLTTVTFNGSGSSDPDGTVASYAWNFGDGSTATGVTAAHTFATAGTFTVTLTVTDNLGAAVSDTAIVNATNRAPVANAGNDQTALSLTTLTFNGSGSSDPDGSLSSYSWNFGDGSTATGMTASHSFATAGTFTVTLTVTDNLGAAVSDTAMVNATNRAPIANAGADQPAATGVPVSFNGQASTDMDGSITSYTWNFGDGGTGTGSVASHTFASAGTYTVTLTVMDNMGAPGSDAAVASVSVTVPPTPTGLSASPISSSQINLAWTGTGTSFKIEHAGSSTGPWSLIGTTAATTFQDTSLSGCSTWFYHVSACNAAGVCSAFSTSSSTTTQMSVPSAPTGVSASAASSTQINVSWSSNSTCPASSYKIERSASSAGPWTQVGTATAMSYQDPGLTASTAYYYHVRATNSAGDSAYSNFTSATTMAVTGGPGQIDWAKRLGGSSVDVSRAITVDGSGNVVMAGGFMGTTDLGTGPLTSAGGTDLFIAKYSDSGAPIWSVRFGGTGEENVSTMALDRNGNILLLGSFSGATNLGGSPLTSAGNTDIFVAKYSPTGIHIWSKRLGAASIDNGCGIATDTYGNVFISGTFAGTVDFGAAVLTASSGGDGFLVKYAPDGTPLWARSFISTAADVPSKVATDVNGDLFVAGYFSGTLDLGGTLLISAGAEDVFVAKVSGSDGTQIWSKRFGADRSDMGRDLKVDSAGNVLVTGSFYNTIDFGGGALPTAGFQEAFVAKLSGVDGRHLWSRSMGGGSDDKGDAVAVDSTGNVVVTGTFSMTANFGGAPLVSTGGSDMFVAKYSPTGTHVWSCGEGGDIAPYLAVSAIGKVYMTGYFSSSINFDSYTLVSAGSADVYLISQWP